MLSDEKIHHDAEAVRIKKELEYWRQMNPGQPPKDSFWKAIQSLRGRYTITLMAHFFTIDYHRMQKGLSKGWKLTQAESRPEFGELKTEKEQVDIVPIPLQRTSENKEMNLQSSLVVEIMTGASKIIRIKYERGQGPLLRELLEVLS
jgi:hypothetical protein